MQGGNCWLFINHHWIKCVTDAQVVTQGLTSQLNNITLTTLKKQLVDYKMANPAVLQRFTTEKYKRFWYPTRPLFTLITGFFLAGLGFVGILPMSWALYFSAVFAFDDLPLTPILGILTSANNLAHGRKITKALVMITATTLAALTGGLLGFFVLSQLPAFMLAINSFIAATSCSPVLISIGAVTGSLIAHFSNKISPFLGIALGAVIFSCLPIPVPLMVDIVFVCAATLAFVSNIAAKQGLRAYYQYRYGHSNADGYSIDKHPDKIEEFTKSQADKFGVTPKAFSSLLTHCKEKVHGIKSKATFLEEFTNTRQPRSNSYKDIYFGLMNPSATKEDIASIKTLIENSRPVVLRKFKEEAKLDLTSSGTLRNDLKLRTEYHQYKIGVGIPSELIEPFMPSPS